jgi:hypothetical protein
VSADGELRELLLRWDPIGVVGEPEWPADEYDSFIEPLTARLREGASEGDLTEYLEDAVRDQLGLEPDREREAAFARELLAWYGGSQSVDT